MRLLALALAACLCGCESLPEMGNVSASQASEMTRRTYDKFTDCTAIHGPRVALDDFGASHYSIAATRIGNEPLRYNIFITTVRGFRDSWAFWEHARDENGTELIATPIDSRVLRSGALMEKLAIDLPREYLVEISKRPAPLSIRVDGRGARQLITISPREAEGFLIGVERLD